MVIVVVLMTMMQQYKGVLESSQPGSNLWVPLIVELWPWSRQKDFPGRNQSVNSTPGSCSLNSVWILVWKRRHVAMEQFLRKKICLFRCVAARSNWSIVKSWPLWLHPTNTNRNLRTASGQWSLGFAEKWTQSFTNRNVREHLSVLGKTRHLGQLHHHLCHSALWANARFARLPIQFYDPKPFYHKKLLFLWVQTHSRALVDKMVFAQGPPMVGGTKLCQGFLRSLKKRQTIPIILYSPT